MKISPSENNQHELVSQALALPKNLTQVKFPLLVKVSTGLDVISIDPQSDFDKSFISNMKVKLIASLKAIEKSGQYFRGTRINDVGSQIESYIVHQLNAPPFTVRQLGQKGYPDTELIFNNETIYMELKTSGNNLESNYRYFYYSTGRKIKKNARHILLSILAHSSDQGYWTVKSFILSDLSRLKVKLKAEFNSSKKELMEEDARIAIIS